MFLKNNHINYPITCGMNALRITIQDNVLFNLADPVFKYCVSLVLVYVIKDAADNFITSWNYHRVPGPSGFISTENMKATKRTTPESVLMYEPNGGRPNREGKFGRDPLVARSDLYESRTVLFSLKVHLPKSHFLK